jgi:hypothetical protein
MADDHYVQQAFTKGFTDSKGALYLFDKKIGKLREGVYPRSVLFEKEYETTFLAKVLKAIENSGMEGIALVRESHYDAITVEILQGLLVYLIAHLTRSPQHFSALGAKTPEERETEFLLGTAQKTLNAGNVSFLPVQFRPSAVPLYLTDDPVAIIPVGQRQGLIAFPIASRQMIAGVFPSPRAGEHHLAWQNAPWVAPDYMAEKLNIHLFRRASRFVLCQDRITPPVGQT